MNLKIQVTRIIKSFLVMVVTLALIQGVLLFSNITITSEKARQVLVEQITILTKRDTYIEGHVRISVSLFPEVIVDRIHIKNVDDFDSEDFVSIAKARVKLSLIPLLTGRLVLDEIEAEDILVNLIVNKDGSNNWSLQHYRQQQSESTETRKESPGWFSERKRPSIGVFSLSDISIVLRDEKDEKTIEYKLSSLLVDLENITSPKAEISGSIQGYPYHASFVSDSMDDLGSGLVWNVRGKGRIANSKSEIHAVIQLTKQALEGNIDLNIFDVNLGLLLEHSGLIKLEGAASRELNIHVKLKGNDVTDALTNAVLDLDLQDGYFKWHARLKDETRVLKFSKARLQTAWEKPVKLQLDGKLFDEQIKLDFKTSRLSEFFDEMTELDVDLTADIAESNIILAGTVELPVTKERFQLDVIFKGKELEKLNKILNSELPPFNNYSLTGKITSNESGYIVRADDATIGDTHFNAVIVIDTNAFKPFWTVNLNSQKLQIKDFEFLDLEVEEMKASTIKESLKRTNVVTGKQPGWRLKKIVDNPRMHLDLSLNVEQVMAGDSALGSSILKLKMLDDTLMLENAELNIPGGKLKSSASFRIKDERVTGHLKLYIDKFEYGAVARYFVPGSPEGGVLSTRIDMQLDGPDFMHLFDDASGKLDVALWPRNTKSKIFDLWATNLFLIILPEIRKKESRMNCMVALMDIDEGIMKEDFFGIDTTRVWMTGNINVDFKQEYVKLSLYPRSKTAKLFAVQAPIRAEGGFDDIGLITSPVDLTAAYVSFITSPLHVPARRIFENKVPEDASEACERFFDREYVKQLKVKLEAEEQKEIDEWLDSD